MAWFHGDSDEVSGSPKILAELRDDGEIISRKTVAKVMRRLVLKGVCPKRWRTTTVIDGADLRSLRRRSPMQQRCHQTGTVAAEASASWTTLTCGFLLTMRVRVGSDYRCADALDRDLHSSV